VASLILLFVFVHVVMVSGRANHHRRGEESYASGVNRGRFRIFPCADGVSLRNGNDLDVSELVSQAYKSSPLSRSRGL
jgi:hypothetical protein